MGGGEGRNAEAATDTGSRTIAGAGRSRVWTAAGAGMGSAGFSTLSTFMLGRMSPSS
jgi:hypothetical protein